MRLVNWIVLGFALYAFSFVPLGEKTGLEHLRAILKTDASQQAISELNSAGRRLVDELLGEEPRTVQGEPVLPELDDPRSKRSPERTRATSPGSDRVQPVVPELSNLLTTSLYGGAATYPAMDFAPAESETRAQCIAPSGP
jgi:hypothetical protein